MALTANGVKEVAKAIAAGVGAAVSYFTSVIIGIDPTAGFADLNTVQWLGVIPVVLTVYGVTWAIPNRPQETSDI